jgi:glycosyltransferase involved in cell wall biosynthesis
MSRLAVIGTFHRRPWAIPRIAEALRAQTRKPDELWLLWDDEDDLNALCDLLIDMDDLGVHVYLERVTPSPDAIPYSDKINRALDWTLADNIAYLTDDSLPHPDKYRLMVEKLDQGHGAVYCSQDYGRADGPDHWLAGGTHQGNRMALEPETDPYCRVDHTQVAHARSDDRWPLDRTYMRLGDAMFFRQLAASMGPFQPIPEILDWTRQLPDGVTGNG